jgi:hypothetical protein
VISADDLATIIIKRVIFHDVPKKVRGGSAKPTLSDVVTPVDPQQKTHLKVKLTRVIGSKHAYPVQFLETSGSPLPGLTRHITKNGCTADQFVKATQTLANYLFEQHVGSVSPGLLCVIEGTSSGLAALILMKLEREGGAQLTLSGAPGHQTFSMSVLNDLVLTDGTRLFKSAMFIRTGPGEDEFRSTVSDSQIPVTSSDDLAQFWIRFLGTTFLIEPRVATQRFFESAVSFINVAIPDPIVKSDVYDHLQSQVKSQKKIFSPKHFIEEFVPVDYQEQFTEHLAQEHIPLTQFTKALDDIQSKLKRRAYETKQGGMISVPADLPDLVEVRAEDILVKDSVLKIR